MSDDGYVDLDRLLNPDAEPERGVAPDWLPTCGVLPGSRNTRADVITDKTASGLSVEAQADRVNGTACAAKANDLPVGDQEAAFAEAVANREAVEDRLVALDEVYERQDADYRGLAFQVSIEIEGAQLNGATIEDGDDFDLCDFSEDTQTNTRIAAALREEVSAAINPVAGHFRHMGLIRSDESGALSFYLLWEGDDEGVAPEVLAENVGRNIALNAVPGATMTLRVDTRPWNATMLFEDARKDGLPVGDWAPDDATPDLAPGDNESRGNWLGRVALTDEHIERLMFRWRRCGQNLDGFATFNFADARLRTGVETEWLIDRKLPRGQVSVLYGAGAAGKSSLLHSLVAALGAEEDGPARHFLGTPITGSYTAVYISGEDTEDRINHRARRHAVAYGNSVYGAILDATRTLEELIRPLWSYPELDCVVIDNIGHFLEGDETQLHVARQFEKPLTRLARAKNAAIILIGHLTKAGEMARTVQAIKSAKGSRGSGGFITGPRVSWAMVKRADDTCEVGPIKTNFGSDEYWLPDGSGEIFRFDDTTYTLEPLSPGRRGASPLRPQADQPPGAVLKAVARCNQEGAVVRRSGKSGLYELRLPELVGVSRAAILREIDALIDAGILSDGSDGLAAATPGSGSGDDQ